ncbi:hypothetical protein [Streptomyces sp. NPDC001020]
MSGRIFSHASSGFHRYSPARLGKPRPHRARVPVLQRRHSAANLDLDTQQREDFQLILDIHCGHRGPRHHGQARQVLAALNRCLAFFHPVLGFGQEPAQVLDFLEDRGGGLRHVLLRLAGLHTQCFGLNCGRRAHSVEGGGLDPDLSFKFRDPVFMRFLRAARKPEQVFGDAFQFFRFAQKVGDLPPGVLLDEVGVDLRASLVFTHR